MFSCLIEMPARQRAPTPLRKPGMWMAAVAVCLSLLSPAGGAAEIPQADLDGSLIRAAGNGDLRSYNLVLGLGANPRAVDAHGNNAVLTATEGAQPALLRIALDAGASPNARGASGFTPLTHATMQGSLPMTRLLLKAGANVNLKNANGDTPLHLAVAFQRAEIMADLLSSARIDVRNAGGETPLMVAVRVNNQAALQRLLAQGADPNVADNNGATPLVAAILEDREAMALALVEAGARFDTLLGTYTPLRMARVKGQETLAALLAARGARD
jgi:ankyrin repeat protein